MTVSMTDASQRRVSSTQAWARLRQRAGGLTPLLVFLHVGHEMRTAARDACQHSGLQAGRYLARSGYQVELVSLLAHVVAHVTDDFPEHASDAFGGDPV